MYMCNTLMAIVSTLGIASFPGPFFNVQHCMKCWDGPENEGMCDIIGEMNE